MRGKVAAAQERAAAGAGWREGVSVPSVPVFSRQAACKPCCCGRRQLMGWRSLRHRGVRSAAGQQPCLCLLGQSTRRALVCCAVFAAGRYMYKGGKLVPTSLDLYLALEYCDQGRVSAEEECVRARVCVCVLFQHRECACSLRVGRLCVGRVQVADTVCACRHCVCTGGNAHLCVSAAAGGSCWLGCC